MYIYIYIYIFGTISRNVVCNFRITLFDIFKKSSRSLSLSLAILANGYKVVGDVASLSCCYCNAATMHGDAKKLVGKAIRGK